MKKIEGQLNLFQSTQAALPLVYQKKPAEAVPEPEIDQSFVDRFRQIKSKYSDAIAFIGHGNHYLAFDEDAIKAADVLELSCIMANQPFYRKLVVPHHSLTHWGYLDKIKKAGYRIAIADQL